jgi:hypothetical protein
MPAILGTQEAKIRRSTDGSQHRQTVNKIPIFKITRAQWTGAVAQVVKCLPRKLKALSSNPSTAKKQKNYSNL